MSENDTDKAGQRESFRYPVSSGQALQLVVNEKVHEIADIGSNGVGIYIPDKKQLGDVGDTFMSTLRCGDTLIEIECRVAHLTAESAGLIRCGLEFCDLQDDVESKLFECLTRRQESYFAGF